MCNYREWSRVFACVPSFVPRVNPVHVEVDSVSLNKKRCNNDHWFLAMQPTLSARRNVPDLFRHQAPRILQRSQLRHVLQLGQLADCLSELTSDRGQIILQRQRFGGLLLGLVAALGDLIDSMCHLSDSLAMVQRRFCDDSDARFRCCQFRCFLLHLRR